MSIISNFNVGDCVEFKHFISVIPSENFEYAICNGKIVNNDTPDLLEIQTYNNVSRNFTGPIQYVNPSLIIRSYSRDKISQLTPRIILKELWKDLIFREIKAVKIKDPYLITRDYINEDGFIRTEKTTDDNDINSNVHYKDYFGFTTHRSLRNNDMYCNQEIFFSRKCYGELNLNGKFITGNFSLRRGFKSVPPTRMQYICGLVETGERGLFYRKWFICSKEFLTLWTMICEPENHSLKNKIDDKYVTKSFDELLSELDTSKYSSYYSIMNSNDDVRTDKFVGYNVENQALYIPNIYQNIAKSLFTKMSNNSSENTEYIDYDERLRSDLVWMKS